ncbi:MAG: tetratricopeptide repeat protein [Vulcanimicrobiota bacterium]
MEYESLRACALAGALTEDDWRSIRRQARQGDVGAEFLLGFADVSPRTRRKWLTRAADHGHAEAFFLLHGGYPIHNAGGWLERSAERGCAEAQSALGCYYAWEPNRDEVKMRYWYGQAALQGGGVAMYEFGFSLLLGEGGPADPEGAVAWLEKAAATDAHTAEEARGLLGDVLSDGLYGVARDPERAEYWRAPHFRPEVVSKWG